MALGFRGFRVGFVPDITTEQESVSIASGHPFAVSVYYVLMRRREFWLRPTGESEWHPDGAVHAEYFRFGWIEHAIVVFATNGSINIKLKLPRNSVSQPCRLSHTDAH